MSVFIKDNATISNSFLAIRGTWIPSSIELLIIYVYALMSKVRSEQERFGTTFNLHGANAFNNLITMTGLVDLPPEVFPSLSALCLDRHLSDHRHILMRELNIDYGPTLFRLYHSWFFKDGFDKLVEDTSKNSVFMESNSIINLKKKFQALRFSIKPWSKEDKQHFIVFKYSIQTRLSDLDKLINQRRGASLDMARKTKIRWSIEGDENFKYLHGIINKKQSQLVILRVLVEDHWIVEPSKMKQRYWNLIDQDVVYADSDFFNSSKFPTGCNSLFIILIPKMHDAMVVKDFIPISMIGSVYKIVAKNLANRFVVKWRGWMQGCLNSVMGSILVNGFLTSEFKFYKGLKQGDPLLPYLVMLIVESLNLSFKNLLNACIFNGIHIDDSLIMSHLFYADDAVFVDKWDKSNLMTIVNVLECFFLASGLKINLHKSKLIVSMGVINNMESYRMDFFNGVENIERRTSLIGWRKIFASKKKGGLGLSCYFALNRALLIKWIQPFISNGSSLWYRFIKAIYGARGALDNPHMLSRRSPWLDIIREFNALSSKGINLHSLVKKNVGNGENTSFWYDIWLADFPLKHIYPRLFALEIDKHASVAVKLRDSSLISYVKTRRGVE
ncbi:RNA-directed DNA polymerase, eukaryota [Tanacetum coccineum]|uniref:RNA-directed DNA polymerase, eukaryota n=1 Tax=Tanacetum coccineum TaxID=301880 RepID=A0ABQ4X2N6_9ASTR